MGRRTVGVLVLGQTVPVAYIEDGHWPASTIGTNETIAWHKGSTNSRIIGLKRGNLEHSDAKKFGKKYPINKMNEMLCSRKRSTDKVLF
jgi:hypothetical protein